MPVDLGACSCDMLLRLSDRDGADNLPGACVVFCCVCCDLGAPDMIFDCSDRCSVLLSLADLLANDSRELMLRVEPSSFDLLLLFDAAAAVVPVAVSACFLAGGARIRVCGCCCCCCTGIDCCCCCWCSLRLRLESLRSLRADEKPLLELVRFEICDLPDAPVVRSVLSLLLNSLSFSSIECF